MAINPYNCSPQIMKTYLQIIGAIPIALGILAASACTADQTPQNTTQTTQLLQAGPEAMVLMDEAYGPHPNQNFDIYLPEDRSQATTKVLVLIHGGGWIDGDKENMDFMVDEFLTRFPNHAIVNTNYVLANPPQVPAFPNQFIDIDHLLDHIQDQGANYQVAPKFGLFGISAGAHLALMSDYHYDPNDRIKLVGSMVGPTDLTDPFYLDNSSFEDFLPLFFETSTSETNGGAMAELSPVSYVGEHCSPTLLFYGQTDPMVPTSNGYALNNLLNQHMVSNSLSVYPGGHFFNWPATDLENMYGQIETYVAAYLGNTASE